MTEKDEKIILCDFGPHPLAASAPRVNFSGAMINVEGTPGSLTLDFCSWAHAVAWAQAQREFGTPPAG